MAASSPAMSSWRMATAQASPARWARTTSSPTSLTPTSRAQPVQSAAGLALLALERDHSAERGQVCPGDVGVPGERGLALLVGRLLLGHVGLLWVGQALARQEG